MYLHFAKWLISALLGGIVSWAADSFLIDRIFPFEETSKESADPIELVDPVQDEVIDEEPPTEISRDPQPPPVAEISEMPALDKVESEELTLTDKHGRTAEGLLLVLSQTYRWKFESTSSVEYSDGRAILDYRNEILKQPGMQYYLAQAEKVIALGAASCEGVDNVEAERARDRAEHLASWVAEASPTPVDTHTLVLGKHLGECSGPSKETSAQRRVVLIVLLRSDPDLDTANALFRELQALSKKTLLKIDPAHYGLFEYAPH